jgi:N-glycosylase/DNA lyase
MSPDVSPNWIAAHDYDLDATLSSGQAFRWRKQNGCWEGFVGRRWVRLLPGHGGWQAEAVHLDPVARDPGTERDDAATWAWLRHYLQADVDLAEILATFPEDEPLRASIAACRGLRLLRQEPWECLVSFICSSTKQIVQIQQIIELLCARFGGRMPRPRPPVTTENGALEPAGAGEVFAFPSAERLAGASEAELRACKMGFRAPYVQAAARAVAEGALDLERLRHVGCGEARAALLRLPGVGAKIANCVLLFAYGYPEAFPVDVWVMKALRQLYFPRRQPSPARLRRFVETYFGPNAGYAQQYLFHYMRTARTSAGPSSG